MTTEGRCPEACVDGFGGSQTRLNGRYPREEANGAFVQWYNRPKGLSLAQAPSTNRWEFFDVSVGRVSVAIEDARGGGTASEMPQDEYYLTEDGEYSILFRCCGTFADGGSSIALRGAGGDASGDDNSRDVFSLRTMIVILAVFAGVLLSLLMACSVLRRMRRKKADACRTTDALAHQISADAKAAGGGKAARGQGAAAADGDAAPKRSKKNQNESPKKGAAPPSPGAAPALPALEDVSPQSRGDGELLVPVSGPVSPSAAGAAERLALALPAAALFQSPRAAGASGGGGHRRAQPPSNASSPSLTVSSVSPTPKVLAITDGGGRPRSRRNRRSPERPRSRAGRAAELPGELPDPSAHDAVEILEGSLDDAWATWSAPQGLSWSRPTSAAGGAARKESWDTIDSSDKQSEDLRLAARAAEPVRLLKSTLLPMQLSPPTLQLKEPPDAWRRATNKKNGPRWAQGVSFALNRIDRRPPTTGSNASRRTSAPAEDHYTTDLAASLGRSATASHRGRFEGPLTDWTLEDSEQHPDFAAEATAGSCDEDDEDEEEDFEVGQRVRLKGLREGTWNHAEGVTEDYDRISGRWCVRFFDGRTKEVHTANLECASRPPSRITRRPRTVDSVGLSSTTASPPPPSTAGHRRRHVSAESAVAARPNTAASFADYVPSLPGPVKSIQMAEDDAGVPIGYSSEGTTKVRGRGSSRSGRSGKRPPKRTGRGADSTPPSISDRMRRAMSR